jgi:manganese efflux pump family protein
MTLSPFRATLGDAMWLKVAALMAPVGLDAFAVSAALAVSGVSRARRTQAWILLAVTEAGMPLIGLAIGRPLAAIGRAADYVAVAVLLILAGRMLLGGEDEQPLDVLLRRRTLGIVAIATSAGLDELAIGIPLGLLRLPLAPIVAWIIIQAFGMSFLGLRLGTRVGERTREGAERLSGVLLAAVAIGLLIETLVGSGPV